MIWQRSQLWPPQSIRNEYEELTGRTFVLTQIGADGVSMLWYDEIVSTHDFRLRARHGLTLTQYELILEAQDGLCGLCDEPPVKTSYGPKLFVDHDHETNRIRGLLHNGCNGRIQGNVERWAKSAQARRWMDGIIKQVDRSVEYVDATPYDFERFQIAFYVTHPPAQQVAPFIVPWCSCCSHRTELEAQGRELATPSPYPTFGGVGSKSLIEGESLRGLTGE